MPEGYVKTDLQKGIATIEFFHPQSNSLPGWLLEELAIQITAAGKDDAVKVMILRSATDSQPAGKPAVFCAGASFDGLIAIKNEQEGLAFFSGFAIVINAVRHAPKFVIGRIRGRCVGGGVGLVAACDHALATADAEIRLSELAIGIGPFVIGPAVQRKTGIAAFTESALQPAKWFGTAWAKEKGLFNEVFESPDELDNAIARLAETLMTYSPLAMAEIKKICWQGTENWDTLLLDRAAISGKLVLSDFTRDAIRQFKLKK